MNAPSQINKETSACNILNFEPVKLQEDNRSSTKECKRKKGYFVTKIVLTYCEKNCSSDREKLLKFETEGRKFANILTSQFVQTVKSQNNNFW